MLFRKILSRLPDKKALMSSKLLTAEDRFKGKISTKFNFGWGSATYPADGANSAPPGSLDGF